MRQDPAGIAPERALVFVVAGSIANFYRAARDVGIEIFSEFDLDDLVDIPEGFVPPQGSETLGRTLYATLPSLETFQQLLRLWNAHQRGEDAPHGAAPWWQLFSLLLEIRPWGPEDRLGLDTRRLIEERLPLDPDAPMSIEFEIWPSAKDDLRNTWREELIRRIEDADGEILDQSSIQTRGFVYEALLAQFSASRVQDMLDSREEINELITYDGIQYILPQTIGQALPSGPDSIGDDADITGELDGTAPARVALLDGTPAAAHRALGDAVRIEDIHDLVPLSQVQHRYHATAMASLIMRGDLGSDGEGLEDTSLVCVPILVDHEDGASTPNGKLIVDLLHSTLTRLISGDDPLAPDVFVVNFSVGVFDSNFAGRISSLARLIDWWAEEEGLLFVISAGNIGDLTLTGVTPAQFEAATAEERKSLVRDAIVANTMNRTLLSPSESLNGLTVGAISLDLSDGGAPAQAGIFRVEEDGDYLPQYTSALGLGVIRTIKPDLMEAGGVLEFRLRQSGASSVLRALSISNRTGLVAASPVGGNISTQRSRGTSAATAIVTRHILKAAEHLVGEDGPFEGQELPRRQLALLTRALSINAAEWPSDALALYEQERVRLGHHTRARPEVCRNYGHGLIFEELMFESPDGGVTLVGYGSIRKDQAKIFQMPTPPSMVGERLPRSMRVTLAWFSPVSLSRAQYKLASLEAVSAAGFEGEQDDGWGFDLKAKDLDANIIKRGSVWSKRMMHRIQTVPDYDDDFELPICVQCRDSSGGGLNPDEDIEFAIAVTLQVEAEVQFDIFQEIEDKIRLRLEPVAR